MRNAPYSQIALALALSSVGGFIDAVGYLNSGGFFLSFMSGNSTRLGVGIGGVAWLAAKIAASIIGTFVAGVAFGTLIGKRAGTDRLMAILPLEVLLLTVAALLETIGHKTMALGVCVLSMGVINTIFQREGEVSIGLTYMTGTLVKIGQHIASAMQGGARLDWLPYFGLWTSLVTGAVCGTIADHIVGMHAVWGAAAYMAFLTVITALAWRRGFRL